MKTFHQFAVIAIAGASFALSSCSTGGSSPSGFLRNYKQLDAGYGTEDAVSAYLKPGVDLKKYDSVLIDPVTTVVSNSSITPGVTDQLAAYLSESLRSQMDSNMKLTTTPGPTTLRVRTALTDVIAGREAGKPVTQVHANPQVTMTGTLGSDALAAFISNVSFEGEILDSVTGERLSALSDQRLGSKREATKSTSWAAVRSATSQGAARLWKRFSAARGE